jgi:hypothetical protein
MHAFSYGPLVKMTKILQKLKKNKNKAVDRWCLSFLFYKEEKDVFTFGIKTK